MSENKIDPRMQVVIDLIPSDTPLLRASRYDHYSPLLTPMHSGSACTSTHTADIDAREALQGIAVPDGCLMAMLVDELTRVRAELAEVKPHLADAQEFIDGGTRLGVRS